MTDLVAGRVDFALPTFTVAQGFYREKKIKVLAIDADKRAAEMPEVPTLTELGFGSEKVASWVGLAAPAGTDDAIVRKLNDAFIEASRDPQLQQRLAANGTPIHTSTPAEMERLLTEEVARTRELVRALGIKQ